MPASETSGRRDQPAYHGLPILKAPVWTWEVGAYFFIGGLAGMSAVLAAVLWFVARDVGAAIDGLLLAVIGAVLSAALLVMDLGRPRRFLYMLRVFKWRSPMSVGVWLLTAFGGCATGALVVALWYAHGGSGVARWLTAILSTCAALCGSVVATYTGVLIGATAIPVWNLHRRVLPLAFGSAGLGSASAVLELLGRAPGPLNALGYGAAGAELLLGLWIELRRHGFVDRALRAGTSGALTRIALLAAPVSILLRALRWTAPAGIVFLAGAAVHRFGWLAAGRASAADPRSLLAAQARKRAPPLTSARAPA